MATVYLHSDLVTGHATVGVKDSLPIEGVNFLLGNDLAGELVVPDPIVTVMPCSDNPTDSLEEEFLDLFPCCAVTRSMASS